MKFTIEFEYPIREGEGKVTGLSRMMGQARKILRERVEHPERFTDEVILPRKRGWPKGRPRKPQLEAQL